MKRHFSAPLCACVLAALATASSAFADAGIPWDLTYRHVLADHEIPQNEFIHTWLNRNPHRLIEDKLKNYSGEPITVSVLVEMPDMHAGDPLAWWFIQTDSTARSCEYHPKFPEGRCSDFPPEKVRQLAEEIRNFAVLPYADLASPGLRIGKDETGNPVLGNIMGIISLYLDGQTVQRPMFLFEQMDVRDARELDLKGIRRYDFLEANVERLMRAIRRASLSEAELERHQREAAERKRSALLEKAVHQGDWAQAETLFAEIARDDGSYSVASRASRLLFVPAGKGDVAGVDFLLKKGARIDADGNLPLRTAIDTDDVRMVAHLLDKGAKIDRPEDESSSRIGRTVLEHAVAQGTESMVRFLVRRGANVNRIGGNCSTPYSVTQSWIGARNKDVMQRLLLELGADPESHDKCLKMRQLLQSRRK